MLIHPGANSAATSPAILARRSGARCAGSGGPRSPSSRSLGIDQGPPTFSLPPACKVIGVFSNVNRPIGGLVGSKTEFEFRISNPAEWQSGFTFHVRSILPLIPRGVRETASLLCDQPDIRNCRGIPFGIKHSLYSDTDKNSIFEIRNS